MEKITKARMDDLSKTTKIPEDFMNILLDSKKKYAVIIYSSSAESINIIPTSSSKVVKAVLQMKDFQRDFWKTLRDLLVKNKFKCFYTSAICPLGRDYVYEGYFEQDRTGTIVKVLKEHFSKLKGVMDVKISRLRPRKKASPARHHHNQIERGSVIDHRKDSQMEKKSTSQKN